MKRTDQYKSQWVTHEQLDTPLCDIFPDVRTDGTARLYVEVACEILGVKPLILEKLSYEQLNLYMDGLEHQIDRLIERGAVQ